MDITNLDKAEVLAVLYNNAHTQGMGILHYEKKDMTKEEAQEFLKQTTYFDYLKGRVMKVDLSGSELKTALYNRDNGQDSAENAIKTLVD